ncbi:hypothetical protein ES702_03092 [subsurface metagenome]
MDKRSSTTAKLRISRLMTGRTPWNKGIGLEDSRIRKGIKTRKEFAELRLLIRLAYTLKEV